MVVGGGGGFFVLFHFHVIGNTVVDTVGIYSLV